MGQESQVRAYVRVSTEEQALSGYSLQAQADRLLALAAAFGWPVAAVYRDEGYSAKDMHRPGLQQLLAEAQPGDVVLVYKLDRLTRSVRDLDELLRTFDRRGLTFRSATEQFETATASGRLFLRLITEIAQWERETIAERSAMGKRKKVELGEWPGGPVPFGYGAVPSGRVKAGKALLQLVPDPQRAHVVAAIFRRYLDGYGLRSICQWLNEEMAVRTTSGARWRVSSLARLLTNPLYCGDVVHGRRSPGGGAATRVPGSHEQLVDRAQFAQVEAMFARRRSMAPRQATGQYPLAGVARCGVCGGPVDTARDRRRPGYRYRCRNYTNGVGCGHPGEPALAGVHGPAAEVRVVAAMAAAPVPATLALFFALLSGTPDDAAAEADRLRAERAETEQAIRRWDRAYESGDITLEEYRDRAGPHRERLRAVDRRLGAVATPRQAAATPLVMNLPLAWAHLEPPERKALLQRFLEAFAAELRLHPARPPEFHPLPG